ncbi:hypothetical protein Salat_2311400 [Sesamum alatum]|uniref:Myb/SANT-like domain-containing protein n=1 Tax=Sesamum alatum TaxID=300844 RepID=A0AAE2CEA3_9LAMI|nr:hypothetical protein Salat_2311400 [Sesamum alatum]
MAQANQGPIAPPPPPPPPPFDPRPQSHYFYTARWSKHADMAFIQALYNQALRGQKQLSRTLNMHSLNYARGIINACFNWSFKYIVLKRRLECLTLRYTTFKTILDSPAFEWDRETNFVHATAKRMHVKPYRHVCSIEPYRSNGFVDGGQRVVAAAVVVEQ